jgi:hypothetical protein
MPAQAALIDQFLDSASNLVFGELDSLSPEHRKLFHRTVGEAHDVGLEIVLWPKPQMRLIVFDAAEQGTVLHIWRTRAN